jgi:hypothetical protein
MISLSLASHFSTKEVIQTVNDTVRSGRIHAGSNFHRLEEQCCHRTEGCHVFPVNSWTGASFTASKIIRDCTSFHLLQFYREEYVDLKRDFPNDEGISDSIHAMPSISKMTPKDADNVAEQIQLILTLQGW